MFFQHAERDSLGTSCIFCREMLHLWQSQGEKREGDGVMRRIGNRIVAAVVSLTLVAGLVPTPAFASADDSVVLGNAVGNEEVVPGENQDEPSSEEVASEEDPAESLPGDDAPDESIEDLLDDEVPSDENPAEEDPAADDETSTEEDSAVDDDVLAEEPLDEDASEVDEDATIDVVAGEDVEAADAKDSDEEDALEVADVEGKSTNDKDIAVEEVDADEEAVIEEKKSDDESAKDADGLTAQASAPVITYQAHVQSIGWQNPVTNGRTAGTSGQSLRMEALRVSLPKGTSGGVTYRAHVQNIGWQGWVKNGAVSGTSGRGLRVEAFKMKLTGAIAKKYDIYYRTHIQQFGWLKWAKNGESTGSQGLSLRMEALQVRLVAKGDSAPSSSGSFRLTFVKAPSISYRGHVQSIGWQRWVGNGEMAGTSGQSLRVEALQTRVKGTGLSGQIQLRSHVQSIGWEPGWSTKSGTSGRGLRLEALCVRLTGNLGKYFDVYYRVHAQRIGWMGWAKNGEKSGTSAMSLRLEALEVRVVPKWQAGPGSGENRYIDGKTVSKMGYQNPEGFYQVSSKNVHITSAATAPWDYVTPSRIGVWASRQDCINAFIARAREYLGTPYVWDYSCAPGVGVDCIGLVYQCAYACGMDLGGGTGYDDFNPWAHWTSGSSGWHSHDANNFWNYGRVMHVSLDDRQVGDLISWSGHVAIYLGGDSIIEAYPGSVMYNSLWAHGTPRGCMRLFQ